MGRVDTHSAKRRSLADHWQQPVAVFVKHLKAHGLVGIFANHLGEALRKLDVSDVGGNLVLLR